MPSRGARRIANGEQRHRRTREIRQPRIGAGHGLIPAERSDQAHQRAVGAVAKQRIEQQVPLHQIFVGDTAFALLEPVVDQLALLAHRDDHPVHAQWPARPGHTRQVVLREIRHAPAAARQARRGRVRGTAGALRRVVRHVEVHRLRRAVGVVGHEVVVQLQHLEHIVLDAIAPSLPLAHLQRKAREIGAPRHDLRATGQRHDTHHGKQRQPHHHHRRHGQRALLGGSAARARHRPIDGQHIAERAPVAAQP
jgi:hypothetical protein